MKPIGPLMWEHRLIEKMLSNFDIFTRFFSIRLFSVILGLLIILLSYLSARKIGLDEKITISSGNN